VRRERIPEPPEGFLENPLFDDEEEEAQIETLSVSPLISPGQLPNGEKVTTLSRGPWKCVLAGRTVAGCACKASPLNCQVPNVQPGRNRYLPASFASEMATRVAALKAAGEKPRSPVDGGKWHVAANTRVFDGAGKLRGRLASPGELPDDPGKPKNICITWAAPTGLGVAPAPGMCAKINFGGKKRMAPEGGIERGLDLGRVMAVVVDDHDVPRAPARSPARGCAEGARHRAGEARQLRRCAPPSTCWLRTSSLRPSSIPGRASSRSTESRRRPRRQSGRSLPEAKVGVCASHSPPEQSRDNRWNSPSAGT
jgi:hypothetical protein